MGTKTEKRDKKDKKEKKEKKEKKKSKSVLPVDESVANGSPSVGAESKSDMPGSSPHARSSDDSGEKKSKKRGISETVDEASSKVTSDAKRGRREDAPGSPSGVARPHRMRTRSFDTTAIDVSKELGLEKPESKLDDASGELDKFRIRPQTVAQLKKAGVEKLFPIQVQTFDKIYDGMDVIGRARTGMGKTLAFALPVVERIHKLGLCTGARGREPLILVLAPTRELAKQVSKTFESIGAGLGVVTMYGGTSMEPQKSALWRGVDVVVGTPGRTFDMIERGHLKLNSIRFAILDEADQMLDMGFADDVDKIWEHIPAIKESRGPDGYCKQAKDAQTLLFSATMPKWAMDISKKYMWKPSRVDLVGELDKQASVDVKHLVLQCPWQTKAETVGDIVRVYGGARGRTLIFCETKKECNELVVNPALTVESTALHGDIPQAQREITLEALRSGTIRCLVATDVAARGLDIKGVDLVIQMQPPAGKFSGKVDVDTYVHRSGRTGRAGATGTCITLFTHRQEDHVRGLERATGNTFTRIGAPQPADLMRVCAEEAALSIGEVVSETAEMFRPHAMELIEKSGDSETTLAKALAVIAGYSGKVAMRSLLSSSEGFCTVEFTSPDIIRSPYFVWNALKRELGDDLSEEARGMTLRQDGMGAVFDMPEAKMNLVKAAIEQEGSQLSVCTTLPELKAKEQSSGGYGGRSYGGRSGGRGGGRGRGGGGRFGGRGGGGGRFGGGGGRFGGGGGGYGGGRGRGGGGYGGRGGGGRRGGYGR